MFALGGFGWETEQFDRPRDISARTGLEVFVADFNNERIALHQRNPSKGVYITNKDHLCSTHKAYMDWSPDYFKKLAGKHGKDVLSCINGLINKSVYPEIAYKRAMGIIQLHKDYGSQRLNNACKRALYAETYSYNRIRNILKNNLDKEPVNPEELDKKASHIPQHENLRGASAYQ